MLLDQHFHSNNSDGKKSNDYILEEIKLKGIQFASVTDHDLINYYFYLKAIEMGIDSCLATEISTKTDNGNKNIHITSYSYNFSKDISDILEKTRNGKIEKIKTQIGILEANNFKINYENFINYYKKNEQILII